MTNSELTRSELVNAMVSVGTLLTGPKPLQERMDGLCVAAVHVLGCANINVLVLSGDRYRPMFSFGHTPDMAERLALYNVRRDRPLVKTIEECDSYLLFNDAKNTPSISRIARIADFASVVIVPFTHPDGAPLGYLAAAYDEAKASITVEQAELAMGMARIAQTTLLRDHESQRRREISEAMLTVEENERRRLSSELHDDPLQRMLGLRLGLESLHTRVSDGELKAEIAEFISQCRSASASLREVMVRTHPTAAELVDLQSTLQTLVARMAGDPPVQFNFADDRTLEIPDYVTAALNRIVEQAVRNTLQHANASSLSVLLRDESLGSRVAITDDGIGFDLSEIANGHLGVVSMRERADSLGGKFSIASEAGNGTAISVWLPHR